MAELHTDDTFMWENKLMACPEEDYDRVPREERGVVDPLVNRITHYSRQRIQPVEFIHANDLGFCEGNCIKYVCRWKYKGGIQDLEKAKHYIEMLIDMEKGKNDE